MTQNNSLAQVTFSKQDLHWEGQSKGIIDSGFIIH